MAAVPPVNFVGLGDQGRLRDVLHASGEKWGGGPVFQALLNLGKIYKPNLTVRMFFRWVGEKPPASFS